MPAASEFHFCFPADESQVRHALSHAVAQFDGDLSDDDAGTLELALAEVLNNVVEHAYKGTSVGDISLSLLREKDALACLVEDQGRPMPGLTLPAGVMQDVAELTEDLAEGGWGWALIRALTTDMNYERKDGCNRLRFRVPLPTSAAVA